MSKKRSIVISERITKRSSQAFNLYLTDINKYKLLTVEEEEFYGQLAFNGDKVGIDTLVTSNLRFVVSVAKQFTNNGLILQDLVNEGNIGLQIAATRYNPDLGFKFLTFGVWWIRHKITEFLSGDGRLVKLPLNKINEANEITKIKNNLKQKLQREPSSDEILEEMGLSFSKSNEGVTKYDSSKLENILEMNVNNNFSLDKTITNEEFTTITFLDMMPAPKKTNPDINFNESDVNVVINDILDKLSEKESIVIKMFYGIGYDRNLTLQEISDELELSRERVRQIKENSIQKLRIIGKDKVEVIF